MQEVLRGYNLTHEQIVEHLRSILARTVEADESVRIRCVSVESGNEWHNAICVIDLLEKNQPPQQKQSLRYPRIHLLEERIETVAFIEGILDAISKGIICVDRESVTMNVRARFNEWDFVPSDNNFSKYPGYLYKTPYIQLPQGTHHVPLLAYDLPFYPNAYFAIRDWMDFKQFHMEQDASLGAIYVFVPERRAYFQKLSIEQKTLKVSVVNNHAQELRLKGAWERSNGCVQFDHLVVETNLMISVPDQVEGWELYLLGKDGTVYDFHRETKLWTLGQERVLGVAPGGEEHLVIVQKAIQQGEGETTEFKPYIKERGSKFNELVKSVIAFANTKGGALIVGISDDCVAEGVEREVKQEASKNSSTPETQLERYIGWLRQNIVGELNRNIDLSVSPVVIDGHTVVLISIPEGAQKPYANVKTNSIYIRRGANNVVPHPDHELPDIVRNETYAPSG